MPGRTNSSHFYYVYVLKSKKDGENYTGYTKDLQRRFNEHMTGQVESTCYRRPLELIYYEACLSSVDAKRRENYLKTTGGRRFLAKRLKDYLFS